MGDRILVPETDRPWVIRWAKGTHLNGHLIGLLVCQQPRKKKPPGHLGPFLVALQQTTEVHRLGTTWPMAI